MVFAFKRKLLSVSYPMISLWLAMMLATVSVWKSSTSFWRSMDQVTPFNDHPDDGSSTSSSKTETKPPHQPPPLSNDDKLIIATMDSLQKAVDTSNSWHGRIRRRSSSVYLDEKPEATAAYSSSESTNGKNSKNIIMTTTTTRTNSLSFPSPVVSLFNGTQNCTLNETTLVYLGFGYQGHVFSADIHCGGSTSGERFVLKLASKRITRSQPSDGRTFVSFPLKDFHLQQMLYNRLVHTTTRQEQRPKDDYTLRNDNNNDMVLPSGGLLALTAGTVNLSNRVLKNIADLVNAQEAKPSGHIIMATTSTTQQEKLHASPQEESTKVATHDDGVVASLSVMAPGRNLEKLNFNSTTTTIDLQQRQSMVRQLVEIYHVLVEHQVWHGDMQLRHVHYSTHHPSGTISLIDWDLAVLLDRPSTSPKKNYQLFCLVRQVWELLYLITHICGGGTKHNETSLLPMSGFQLGQVRQQEQLEKPIWKRELEKCRFERPLEWPSKTLTKEVNIHQLYRALEDWVGFDHKNAVVAVHDENDRFSTTAAVKR